MTSAYYTKQYDALRKAIIADIAHLLSMKNEQVVCLLSGVHTCVSEFVDVINCIDNTVVIKEFGDFRSSEEDMDGLEYFVLVGMLREVENRNYTVIM
jgi:hypothetical protein